MHTYTHVCIFIIIIYICVNICIHVYIYILDLYIKVATRFSTSRDDTKRWSADSSIGILIVPVTESDVRSRHSSKSCLQCIPPNVPFIIHIPYHHIISYIIHYYPINYALSHYHPLLSHIWDIFPMGYPIYPIHIGHGHPFATNWADPNNARRGGPPSTPPRWHRGAQNVPWRRRWWWTLPRGVPKAKMLMRKGHTYHISIIESVWWWKSHPSFRWFFQML